ncbi:serine/threonine protein kinase [Burkholderiaceae bacterium DAT-1]|nr:serine/threonine protein kinase [Burkholderiaceae bacterium DAT-1]
MTHTIPYASLTPDCILNAVESLGLFTSGSLLALNSFENRVWQIGMDEGPPLIAKFYRPGRWTDEQILEEHAFAQELAERDIPLVAPLTLNGKTLHHYDSFRFALFPRRGGRPPELEQRDVLEWTGRFLGRIHAVGSSRPFIQRPALNIETFGFASLDTILSTTYLPDSLRQVYEGVARQALSSVIRRFEDAGSVAQLRLHGDCHPGNILWTDAGPHFVDLDDARTGPAIQDLWMLLSGDRQHQTAQLCDLLSGYEDFCEFNSRETMLIEPLRTLRLIHYSAWLARRWDDPAFPAAFPWFDTPRYWEARILELREQIALMDEAPIQV